VTITIVQRDLGPKFDPLADVEPLDVVDLRFAQAFPCLLQDRMQDRCVPAHAESQRHAMSLEIAEELELLQQVSVNQIIDGGLSAEEGIGTVQRYGLEPLEWGGYDQPLRLREVLGDEIGDEVPLRNGDRLPGETGIGVDCSIGLIGPDPDK